MGRVSSTLRQARTPPSDDVIIVMERAFPYKYEQLPPILCTYILWEPDELGKTWSTKWVKNPRLRKTWYEPQNYLELEKVNAMKRETASIQKAKGKYNHLKHDFVVGCPIIEEHLGDCWWDDGKARVPCHLKVEIIGDMVHIGLIDTEQRRSCHTTAKGLQAALESLESHLAAGGAPWRAWGPQKR